MKPYFAVLFALLLSGCYSDIEQNMGACKLRAQSEFPAATWLLGDKRQETVMLCMEAAGYRLERYQRQCPDRSRIQDGVLLPECYAPMGFLSGYANSFETWIRGL